MTALKDIRRDTATGWRKPVFEINTGAISRGYRTVPYPSADQIAYIRSKGGVLILSSDSHAAGTICYDFEEFADLVSTSE